MTGQEDDLVDYTVDELGMAIIDRIGAVTDGPYDSASFWIRTPRGDRLCVCVSPHRLPLGKYLPTRAEDAPAMEAKP